MPSLPRNCPGKKSSPVKFFSILNAYYFIPCMRATVQKAQIPLIWMTCQDYKTTNTQVPCRVNACPYTAVLTACTLIRHNLKTNMDNFCGCAAGWDSLSVLLSWPFLCDQSRQATVYSPMHMDWMHDPVLISLQILTSAQ